MKSFRFLLLAWAAFPLAISAAEPQPDGTSRSPNIVFILCDDLGYGDVRCYQPSSKIPTPNLDRLAADGMKFTDAHSGSAVCTPTRYGVVTGRYAWRSSLKRGVLSGYSPPLIDPDRLTVGGMMQEAGYRTACIGKWHLGLDWTITGVGKGRNPEVDWTKPLRNGPTARGFDTFFGVAASLDMPPYSYILDDRVREAPTIHEPASPFPKYWREGPRSENVVFEDVLGNFGKSAAKYIRDRAKKEETFFLYLPLPSPHKPVIVSEAFQGKTELGPYGDFVHEVDATIGIVIKAVDGAGIAGNTLIMVTSDNGSFMYHTPASVTPDSDEPSASRPAKDHVDDPSIQAYHRHDSNGPLRGTKADVWEGGHRVAFLARWPGVVEAGSVCAETICHVDLMATCAEVAGVKNLPRNAAEDSFSILPLLKTGKWGKKKRGPVVNHSSGGMFAIREGKWKLVFGSGSGGREQPRGKLWEQPYHLFDLEADLGETTNLYSQNPEVAERLTQRMLKLMADGRSR